jgi:hypothetical protein
MTYSKLLKKKLEENWERKRPYVPLRHPVDSVLMGLNGNLIIEARRLASEAS